MTGARKLLWPLVAILWLAGCATPVPPNEPTDMVPRSLSARMPASVDVFVDKVVVDSAAKNGETPFEQMTGKFPFVQPQGLDNYRQGIRLTLQAAGARTSAERTPDADVLRTTILGGMSIPYAEAYSVLFVHYELEDGRNGKVLWSKTVYSQARLDNVQNQAAEKPVANPAYGRLAAANLRQMTDSLAAWLAKSNPRKDSGN